MFLVVLLLLMKCIENVLGGRWWWVSVWLFVMNDCVMSWLLNVWSGFLLGWDLVNRLFVMVLRFNIVSSLLKLDMGLLFGMIWLDVIFFDLVYVD